MPIPVSTVVQIRRLYAQDVSKTRIAEIVGVALSTVCSYLADQPPREVPPLTPDAINTIRERYTSRPNVTELAREFGATRAVIRWHTRDLRHLRLAPETVAIIRKRYAEGETMAEIASDLGIGISTVSKHARGIALHKPGRAISPEKAAEIRALRDQGLTQQQAAQRLGVTRRTVQAYDLRELPSRPHISDSTREQLYMLLDQGRTARSTAALLGLSISTVNRYKTKRESAAARHAEQCQRADLTSSEP